MYQLNGTPALFEVQAEFKNNFITKVITNQPTP
jgi:hypothetical protein